MNIWPFPTEILSVAQRTPARTPRAPTKLDLEKNSIEKRIVAVNTVRIEVRLAKYL
jgi:hypothetical protein